MKLLSRLGNTLHVRADEGPVVLFLFANSFLSGIVLAFYYPPAIALFLSQFTSSDLPSAFILQAVLAYGVSLLYRKLKTRASLGTAQIANVAFMFLSIGLFSLGAQISGSKFFAFVTFTWFNVLVYLTSVQLAELAQALFDIRQIKRLFGLVSSGGAVSGILASFSFPLLLRFIDLRHFSLLCTGVLAVWLALLVPAVGKFRHLLTAPQAPGRAGPQDVAAPLGYFASRYTALISILAVLPTFGLIYVDFMFLGMVREWFEPARMASFLGVFYGVVKISEFTIKAFVTGNLITRFGLRVGLLALPVLLALGLGCAAIVGVLGEKSIFLFALVILSKYFERVVRPALNEPAAQILFQPIPPDQRSLFQSRIEGLPKQLGIGLVGLTLIAFSAIEAIQEVQMIWIFLLILPGWIALVNMLHGEYRNVLQQTLLEESRKPGQGMLKSLSPTELLKEHIRTSTSAHITPSIKLLERIDPAMVPSFVIELLRDSRVGMRLAALREVERLYLVRAAAAIDNLLEVEENIEVRKRAEALSRTLEVMAVDMHSEEHLATLAASPDAAERRRAAMLLGQAGGQVGHALLIDLLQDSDIDVLRAALVAAGMAGHPELWPFMIEHLDSPALCNAAASALIQVGSDILPELELWFNKVARQPRTLHYIVYIYGRLGGPEASQLLWDKFNYPDDRIQRQVLVSLNLCRYQVDPDEEPALREKIEETVENTTWSMAALVDMGRDETSRQMVDALGQEINHNREGLFLLLSLLYDPQLVGPVRDRLVHKTESTQGVVFALELMDVFIAEDLKELVLPILDDITLAQSLKRLEARFPHPRMAPLERIKNIINREYTKVGRWTKAWALHLVPAIEAREVPDELVANLFNPDPVLRETAARSIYRIDPAVYDKKTRKLPEGDRLALDLIAPKGADRELRLTIDKVDFLKTIDVFSDMPELALIRLVAKLEEVEVQAGETLGRRGAEGSHVYILVRGKVRLHDAAGAEEYVDRPTIVGGLESLIAEPGSREATAVENSQLFRLDGDEFFEIVFEHTEWAGPFLLSLDERLQSGAAPEPAEPRSVGG